MEEIEKQVDLENYGFLTSGQAGGASVDFRTNIQLIYQGKLIDKTVKIELTEKDKDEIAQKINTLRTEIGALEIQIGTKEGLKLQTEREVKSLEEEYNNAKNGININREEVFKWYKFVINAIILAAVSIFLAFYYVYVLDKVFNKDIIQVVKDMLAKPPIPLLSMPTWNHVADIIRRQPILLLISFVFFGFGYAIHVFLERKGIVKWIGVISLICLIFVFDFLLAYQIFVTYDGALYQQTGTHAKFFDTPLLAILMILGFVVFCLWSILFHSVTTEWAKRDILNVIRAKIDANKQTLNEIILAIETLKKQVVERNGQIGSLQLSLNKVKVKISDIEHSILQFTKGWIKFLSASPYPNEQLKKEIELIKDEFVVKLKTSNEL
jgi:hypothetical protein